MKKVSTYLEIRTNGHQEQPPQEVERKDWWKGKGDYESLKEVQDGKERIRKKRNQVKRRAKGMRSIKRQNTLPFPSLDFGLPSSKLVGEY
ncbi:unnamed protein product [Arabis nemorensis]|uniref:Uncharacterized protein n=1 Tax=Arabis nemorensis TaxID=586526 RepID=A0A565AZ74_9BRAS|nr:unnamed protein product [Arabis nemorensis]